MIYNLAGTECSFVHRRVIAAAEGFVKGGFQGAAFGALTGGGAGRRRTPRREDFIAKKKISGKKARREARTFDAGIDLFRPSPVAKPRTRVVPVITADPRPVRRPIVTGPEAFTQPFAPTRPARCQAGFRRDDAGNCVRERGVVPAIESFFGVDFSREDPEPRSTKMARRRRQGQAVVGAFGMPAMVPEQVQRVMLDCGPGMVLGTDDLCYPKSVLSSRNKNRKWRRAPKPTVSRADERAIRKAAAARDRVLQLAKDVGLHASKTRPASRSKKGHQHLLAAPGPQVLRVISEETN